MYTLIIYTSQDYFEVSRNELPNDAPSMISEQIDRVLIAILTILIIAHERLRVSVAAHHLDLPVAERPCDRRPPQIRR